MPHSFGYRAKTRDLFAKAPRTAGQEKLSTFLKTYKIGEHVDVKVNPAQHKGMPFKHYHGRTGVVFNVTKRAIGVRINKFVNGKILEKLINVRMEHVLPSKCKDEIKKRIKENEAKKAAVRKGAAKVSLKREPRKPKDGYFYTVENVPETIQPLPFEDLV